MNDYNYLSGKLRSLEKELIPISKLKGFISISLDDVVNTLPQDFRENLVDKLTITSIDNAYYSGLNNLRNILSEGPGSIINKILFIKYDLFNLKRIMLYKLTEKKEKPILINAGIFPHKQLYALVDGETTFYMDRVLSQALELGLRAYYEEEKDTQIFEIAYDSAAELALIQSVEETEIPTSILNYLKKELSLKEFLSFIRGYVNKINWDILKYSVLDISDNRKVFRKLYNTSMDSWEGLIYTLSIPFDRDIIKKFFIYHEIHSFAKAVNSELCTELSDFILKNPGFETVFGYAKKKINELYNIRLILISKLNNINKGDILSKLRI